MPASSLSVTPRSLEPAPTEQRSCRRDAAVNAYAAFVAAIAIGAAVGAIIGFLSFRSGLRGSYFALVTLAFAEVFRIVANASPFAGGAAGTLLKLDMRPENFQFASRAIFF